MARLVRVIKGQWSKSQQGVWRFEEDITVMTRDILVRRDEDVDSLQRQLRGLFNLEQQTPLVITFELPQWMLEPDGETCPPHNILTKADVELLMTVHEWNTEPKLCVVFGPQDVAKYKYTCRSPFTIGRMNFLGEGVTEEEHLATINSKSYLFYYHISHHLYDHSRIIR